MTIKHLVVISCAFVWNSAFTIKIFLFREETIEVLEWKLETNVHYSHICLEIISKFFSFFSVLLTAVYS